MKRGTNNKLKKLRLLLKMSVSDCCRLTGTPRSTWYHWEYDDVDPPPISIAYLSYYKRLKYALQGDLD